MARDEKQAYFDGSKNYCKAKTICFSSGTAGSREKKIVSTLGLNIQQPIGHYATEFIVTRLFLSWELTNNDYRMPRLLRRLVHERDRNPVSLEGDLDAGQAQRAPIHIQDRRVVVEILKKGPE